MTAADVERIVVEILADATLVLTASELESLISQALKDAQAAPPDPLTAADVERSVE